jgi:hypothetical protein
MFAFRRLSGLAFVAATAFAAFASSNASAEIKKVMSACEAQKLCAWLPATVAPPEGWVEDKESSAQHFVTMLVPDKDNLGFDDPIIYVQISYRRDQQTLAENVRMNQDIWRKSEPKVRITPLGTVARGGGGKDAFQAFLYENPTHPKQAFEKMAFALEKLPDGGHYILTVVDTAATRKAVEDSSAAFQAVLSGL